MTTRLSEITVRWDGLERRIEMHASERRGKSTLRSGAILPPRMGVYMGQEHEEEFQLTEIRRADGTTFWEIQIDYPPELNEDDGYGFAIVCFGETAQDALDHARARLEGARRWLDRVMHLED